MPAYSFGCLKTAGVWPDLLAVDVVAVSFDLSCHTSKLGKDKTFCSHGNLSKDVRV